MGIKLYVRLDIVQRIRGGVRFSLLGGPGLEGSVHLLQVVDTTCLLRRSAGFHEVGNRDGGQQGNNGHNDHDLHKRERPVSGCSMLHFDLSSLGCSVNEATGGLLLLH